jgi:CheY-like chemotaxis protein
LTFSRQSAVDIKPVRIESLVNEALDLIQATLPSNIQIRRELRSEALVAVDVTQMRQVLINLCTNAAHAMRGQSGIITVRLSPADHDLDGLADKLETGRGAFVKLSVSDSGHGIPAEIMNRIFDPFFTTKKRGVGTGMGLSISYSIVKRFGGTITAESQPGQGATFNVFLPVIETQAEIESLSMQTMPKGTERILIVNGDSMTHGLDRQVLEQLGYQIQVQDSADAAVKMLQTQPDSADLVVLIRNESDRSLAAVIRKLKSVRSRLPIILVSGYSADPERIRAERLGVEAVIQKPIITHELAEMIRKLLDEDTTA